MKLPVHYVLGMFSLYVNIKIFIAFALFIKELYEILS